MRQTFAALLTDESGVTSIEYGIIAALVVVVAIPAASILGGSMSDAFAKLSSALTPPGKRELMVVGVSRPL